MAAAAGSPELLDAVKVVSDVRPCRKQRADVKAVEADGTTALHWAVQADDLEMTQLLVRAGANVNAANRFGVTPSRLPRPTAVRPLSRRWKPGRTRIPPSRRARRCS